MASIYQVNDADYDGEIVVEFYGYANSSEPFWHVPAWDEQGYPELSGPFDSRAEAQAALAEFLGEEPIGAPMHTRDCAYVVSDGPAPCTCAHWQRVDDELVALGRLPGLPA